MSIPQPGDQAPEVALPDETGTTHRLSDRRGSWTVVYFYPKDDTPGCTTEACHSATCTRDFTGADAEVWGISPDGSGAHAAFRAKYGLRSRSCPTRTTRSRRHTAPGARRQLRQDLHGHRPVELPRRARWRVARTWANVKADGHAEQVREALEDRPARSVRPRAGPVRRCRRA